MTIEERPSLNHVVVATDFSPGAALALRRAPALPLRAGGTISLLHVVPEPVPKALRDRVVAEAERSLRDAATDLRRAVDEHGHGDVKVAPDVVLGTPFVEIVRHARSRGADLVIIGRHGPRALRDAFLGSTAERVIRKGDVPVLLVNQPTPAAYERALVAIDLSEASTSVLDLALTLLPREVRTLRMVHAFHVAFEGWFGAATREQCRRDYGEHATAAAKGISAAYAASGVECRLTLLEGDPRVVVLREAVRDRSDLIVLGTHARTGVAHALLGSVAEWLVRCAPCDVAVTRPARFTFEPP